MQHFQGLAIFADIDLAPNGLVVRAIDFRHAHQFKAVVLKGYGIVQTHSNIALNFITLDHGNAHHHHGNTQVSQVHAPKRWRNSARLFGPCHNLHDQAHDDPGRQGHAHAG